MPSALSSIAARAKAYVQPVCAFVALVAFGYFVWHQTRAVAFPFPLDYGEGPLLEQARRLAHGQNIYHADLGDYPFTIANYPPVFPALLSLGVRAFGCSYTMGRALTFVAALACAAHVGAIVRKVTGSTLGACIGAGFFAATPYVVFWTTLVRIDFVALAFSLGAVSLAAHKPTARWTPVVAALLVTIGVLTRQSHLLAAPLALTCAFATQGLRRAAAFVGPFVAAVALALVVLDRATAHGFFFNTVTANANHFLWPLFTVYVKDVASLYAVPIVIAIGYVATRAPWPPFTARLLTFYLVGATLSALTVGKVGAHVNYMLELVAALAIFCGLASARWARDSWQSAAVNAALAGSIVWVLADAIPRTDGLDAKLNLRDEYAQLVDLIKKEQKPVIADEAMGMIVLTPHPLLLQPFEMTQLSHQGVWDQAPLLRDIRAKHFGLILINDGPATPAAWTRERWTQEMLVAIHANYEPHGALADATIYRPHYDQ